MIGMLQFDNPAIQSSYRNPSYHVGERDRTISFGSLTKIIRYYIGKRHITNYLSGSQHVKGPRWICPGGRE
ncbi:hypothetical protein AVEN_78353-1 [Araneus ventricosus]|uniref:Uncharacterized protein n=1 Tax=Araneus ventricosus TaxID=182803 RepID=A0A4Y2S6M2_ARAVE|nr:hypothetical protein AVEN_78353-1 [Araneus ventricosus]